MTVRVMAQQSGVTTQDHRFAIQAAFAPAGANNARSGVLPNAGTPADLVSVSALQAKVTPFQAWIDGTSNALQAGYLFTSDADVTLTFAAGNGTNPRIDLVVARIRDNTYDASGATSGTIEIVAGAPAASPSAPAVPASSLALWQVLVPANASGGNPINFASARTDRRQYTALRGTPVQVANTAERDAIASPYAGMEAFRLDTKSSEIYDGTAWKPLSSTVTPAAIVFAASGSLNAAQVAGAKALRVRVWGAGGGGGGTAATPAGQSAFGSGGSSGGYAEKVVALSALTFPVAVTVGAGGVGSAGGNGTNGQASSFAAHCAASGGGGGQASSAAATPLVTAISQPPGVGTAGDVQVQGNYGVAGFRLAAVAGIAGGGAPPPGGGGATTTNFATAAGATTTAFGAGGGGAFGGQSAAAQAGGNGGNGLVVVEPIY